MVSMVGIVEMVRMVGMVELVMHGKDGGVSGCGGVGCVFVGIGKFACGYLLREVYGPFSTQNKFEKSSPTSSPKKTLCSPLLKTLHSLCFV